VLEYGILICDLKIVDWGTVAQRREHILDTALAKYAQRKVLGPLDTITSTRPKKDHKRKSPSKANAEDITAQNSSKKLRSSAFEQKGSKMVAKKNFFAAKEVALTIAEQVTRTQEQHEYNKIKKSADKEGYLNNKAQMSQERREKRQLLKEKVRTEMARHLAEKKADERALKRVDQERLALLETVHQHKPAHTVTSFVASQFNTRKSRH